ncbi:MAG: hypothetical protein U0791_21170 [Gemmataceae bacterium]
MTPRIAFVAVLLAPSLGLAQPIGYRGGWEAPGYRAGLGPPGYRGGYSTFQSMGVPYSGGIGYPYGYPYGGITLGFGVGGLGYGYGMGGGYPNGFRSSAVPLRSVRPNLVEPVPVPAATEPAVAVVSLVVPDGAKVWFNDAEAAAPGGKAEFTSAKLTGSTELSLKARWDARTREMRLTLRPGDRMSIDLRKQ